MRPRKGEADATSEATSTPAAAIKSLKLHDSVKDKTAPTSGAGRSSATSGNDDGNDNDDDGDDNVGDIGDGDHEDAREGNIDRDDRVPPGSGDDNDNDNDNDVAPTELPATKTPSRLRKKRSASIRSPEAAAAKDETSKRARRAESGPQSLPPPKPAVSSRAPSAPAGPSASSSRNPFRGPAAGTRSTKRPPPARAPSIESVTMLDQADADTRDNDQGEYSAFNG